MEDMVSKENFINNNFNNFNNFNRIIKDLEVPSNLNRKLKAKNSKTKKGRSNKRYNTQNSHRRVIMEILNL